MKKYKDNIISVIISAILVIFMWHSFLTTGNNIIFVFIFLACYIVMLKTLKIADKRKNIIAIIIAVIFAIVEIVGKSINYDYTLNHIIDKWLPINFIGYTTIAWTCILWIYTAFDKLKEKDKPDGNLANEGNNREGNYKQDNVKEGNAKKKANKNAINNFIEAKPVLVFAIIFILIFLAWTPYFLRYFPGIVTSDSYSQIEEGIGLLPLDDHHPIAHTAIISTCINLGRALFGSINAGIAIYSIISMIIMALLDAGVLTYLKKKEVPNAILGIVLLFYMFYPVNAMYSITMWKDIIFSGMVPIFIMLCYELITNTKEFLSKKSNIIAYVAVSVLTIILRHNGLYVVILTIPFIFIVLRKHWKVLLGIFASILIIYETFNILMFNVLKVSKGSVGEMLSVPLQQIARVEGYHREELEDELLEDINKIFKIENIGDKYNPILSDPVKSQFNADYFKENKIEFIKIWLKLLAKYPKDYIESFISNSYGYYYPEAIGSVVSRVTMDHSNMGIKQEPKIEGKLVEKLDALVDTRDVPLLSMMFSVGFGFWMVIVCLGYNIYSKKYRNILIYLPILVLWLTCIASPVFCEFRYSYPIFTALPLYLLLNLRENINER